MLSILVLLALIMIPCISSRAALSVKNIQTAQPGEFVKEENNWFYQYEDGSFASDCLLKIGKRTYAFSPEGYRLYGWQTIGKSQYYFGKASEGYMYKSRWMITKNGTYYRFTKTGKSVRGWYTLNGKKYYFDKETGKRLYGWQTIGKNKYYFGTRKQGYMYRSTWVTRNKKRYYLQADGTVPKGWLTVSSERYYFSKSGYAYTGTKKISGATYHFNSKGALLYGGAEIKLDSDCAILINADTGKVLYEKRADTKHANASTTKILTCILALEKCKLTEKVTASSNAASQEPSKLYLHAGESFYLKDLLYSLMLPSHNDTAVAIAEHISGSTKNFTKLMNEKAKSIGCTSTNFVTPNGLDKDIQGNALNHYSTARDMAKIAQYAYQNKTFRKIISTQTYSFTSISGYSYWFSSTNELLSQLSGVTGMKTGYTNKAGYCFAGSLEADNGNTYICIVLGGPTSSQRWSDAKKLLEYAGKLN